MEQIRTVRLMTWTLVGASLIVGALLLLGFWIGYRLDNIGMIPQCNGTQQVACMGTTK